MRAALLLLLGLLAGCASLRTDDLKIAVTDLSSQGVVEHFKLEGRVSVKSSEQQYSGGLRWDRYASGETLLMTTPLGQGVAEIRRDNGLLVLTDADGRRQEATDADLLVRKALGAPIPLAGLVYWLSALPRPGAPHVAHLDADGRVLDLEQDGWRIVYDRYRQIGSAWLPGRLFASRSEGIEFRLIVDKWQTP